MVARVLPQGFSICGFALLQEVSRATDDRPYGGWRLFFLAYIYLAARKSMLKIVDKSGVVWYPSDTNQREPHRRRAAGREIRADSARRKGRKQT